MKEKDYSKSNAFNKGKVRNYTLKNGILRWGIKLL